MIIKKTRIDINSTNHNEIDYTIESTHHVESNW